jgi:hypothetical protein
MSTDSSYADAISNLKGGKVDTEEERVEVNQRALIDKILARYASANAVYRELLQNSNDAEATVAEIHFTTSAQQESDVLLMSNDPTTSSTSLSVVLFLLVLVLQYI